MLNRRKTTIALERTGKTTLNARQNKNKKSSFDLYFTEAIAIMALPNLQEVYYLLNSLEFAHSPRVSHNVLGIAEGEDF